MRTCQSKIYLALVVIRGGVIYQKHCSFSGIAGQDERCLWANSNHNTGTETARESKKVPVFVPVSYSNGEKKIIGSTVLFPSTISEMTQYVVKNDCRYLETKTEAVNGIDMLFCSVSLNSEDLIAPAVDVFKKKVNEQTVLVGTVKRALLPNLESAITSNLTSDTYSFVEVENRNRDSEYCIFVLTSHKWAFRGVTETSVSGDLHCFQLQIESLK